MCRRKAEGKLKLQQERVKRIFNQDQLDSLGIASNKGFPWSRETVKKALQLRFSCGDTGYNQLLASGFPFPSVRTLQEKLQSVEFRPGVLSSVFAYLETKVSVFY